MAKEPGKHSSLEPHKKVRNHKLRDRKRLGARHLHPQASLFHPVSTCCSSHSSHSSHSAAQVLCNTGSKNMGPPNGRSHLLHFTGRRAPGGAGETFRAGAGDAFRAGNTFSCAGEGRVWERCSQNLPKLIWNTVICHDVPSCCIVTKTQQIGPWVNQARPLYDLGLPQSTLQKLYHG